MKLTHYIFVAIMLIVATLSGVYLFSEQKQESLVAPGVTRSAVTAEQLEKPVTIKEDKKEDKSVDWSAISAGIIAIIGAGGAVLSRVNSSKNDKFREDVNEKFEGIYTLLDEFKDTQYRRSIDMELSRIGFEAIGFVKDEDVKVFMEGVVDRTRNFTRDTMRHGFDEESYTNAISKIGARVVECRGQVKLLNLNNNFEKLINEVREKNLNVLISNLKILSLDKEYNDKYLRYQDIMCKFLKSFLRDIIYSHVEYTKRND